jgi:hypothetical protein
MHGSKAFLEHMACKLLIQVELANKKSYSRTEQNIIISQLIRRKLTNKEKKCLCGNFGIKCYEDILEGTRIKVNSKIFHSKNYNRKRNSDSITILFENNFYIFLNIKIKFMRE